MLFLARMYGAGLILSQTLFTSTGELIKGNKWKIVTPKKERCKYFVYYNVIDCTVRALSISISNRKKYHTKKFDI